MNKIRNQKPRNWIFLRGLTRHSGHWHEFKTIFKKHFPQDEIELLDLRGNGDLAFSSSYFSIAENVRDLRSRSDFLRNQKSVHLLSISMGAMIATEWAHHYPEEIQGAVLINTSDRDSSRFYQRLQTSSWPQILSAIQNHQDPVKKELGIIDLTTELISQKTKEELAICFSKMPATSFKNFLKQLFAASQYRFPENKPKTEILILSGRQDKLVSSTCSELLAKKWTLQAHAHPTAGHDLSLDCPDWICEQIQTWLSLT